MHPTPDSEAVSPDGAEGFSLELTRVLADSYVRRILVAPRGETLEVGLHRMRFVAPEAADGVDGDQARVVGLRFTGVMAAASQAHRNDGSEEEPAWVPDDSDWVMALAYEGGLPPVVRGAAIGSADTLKRLDDAAEDLLWYAGSPADLDAFRRAPILFEMTAEGVLVTGAEARMRLFVAALGVETRDRQGRTSLERIQEDGEAFLAAWGRYRQAGALDPARPDDLSFEWLQSLPEEGRPDSDWDADEAEA